MITTQQPTVLISVPHGGSAGNILRTGLIDRVVESIESAQLVLVSPLVGDPAFVREFGQPRVRLEPLPAHRPAGLEARLLSLVQASYIDSAVTEAVRIRGAEAIANKTIRFVRAKHLLASAVAPSMMRKESRYDLSDRLVSHPIAERLFDRYRPVLVVADNPGLILSEVPLLRTAARRGVPTIAVDASWDNFTNKILPVRRVDRLIVWNQLMKEQAVALHGYRPDAVHVTGPPHWDLYFRAPRSAREAFFRRIGADPSRKLVTLTTTPLELYAHYDHVLRVMIDAMSRGRWPYPCQILVRVHPRDDVDRYRAFAAVPDVIVEKPFRATIKAGDGLAVDITADSQHHLADTLAFSDVVVQVASTIAIEAAIFDTPVVNVSFDGEVESEQPSARRYLRFPHFANVARHDAVMPADSPEQLVEGIARYLIDPTIHASGRRLVVREQCQFLDGRSAERVAGCVVGMLRDVCGLPEPQPESPPLRSEAVNLQ